MNSPDRRSARLHLRAAALALALAVVAGGAALWRACWLEGHFAHAAAPENSRVRDLGIVWQKENFDHADLLSLYGSSELIKKAPNKANLFFASYPSGFAVSPVGRPSCTSLILLEKIAASATQARRRKVVISVSPSWFIAKGANHEGFEGNYSMMQASEIFFGAPLSLPLKHRIAGRMLRYPQAIEKSPVLAVAVQALASDRLRDRALYYATWPLGRLQNVVYRLQDHFEVIGDLREDSKLRRMPERKAVKLDWKQLLAEARSFVKPLQEEGDPEERLRHFSDDAAFLRALERSYEWGDFELLLRAVKELDLDALVISMPIERAHFEAMGLSRSSIDAYSLRLREFAGRYGVPVADFPEFGTEPDFFADHFGHPSAMGWLYFDRALDDFFHGRTPRQEVIQAAGEARPKAAPNTRPGALPPLPPSGPSSATPGT